MGLTFQVIDFIANPGLREPTVWTMFWGTMAFAIALSNLHRAGRISDLMVTHKGTSAADLQ
jgi:hypothetical protein